MKKTHSFPVNNGSNLLFVLKFLKNARKRHLQYQCCCQNSLQPSIIVTIIIVIIITRCPLSFVLCYLSTKDHCNCLNRNSAHTTFLHLFYRCNSGLIIPQGQTRSFYCKAPLIGRYVTIVVPRQTQLTLCEVKVFQTKLDDGKSFSTIFIKLNESAYFLAPRFLYTAQLFPFSLNLILFLTGSKIGLFKSINEIPYSVTGFK